MTKTLTVRPERKATTQNLPKFEKRTGLFTGVSAAALMLGVVANDAIAAGITVTKPTTSVVVGTKQHFDFIDIEAPVFNDVINNGSIGPGDSPSIVVDGPNGGSVGGDIINNGLITGTMAGIFVSGTTKNPDPVGGGIYNFGTISIIRGTATPIFSSAYGVLVSGPAIVTSVSNTGFIGAALFATGTGHTAGGVVISSSGPLASSITNSGAIIGVGFASGSTGLADTDAQILAVGAAATNTAGAGATTNTITNNTGGLMGGAAIAIGSGPGATASATAAGAVILHNGTSAAANVATISNASSATLGGIAFASIFASTGAANANAVGASQVGSGGSSLSQNVNNSGFLGAGAIAFASGFNTINANASATGVNQSASSSPTISQTVNNSGLILGFALASGVAATGTPLANANASSAHALGIGQSASGSVGTVSNTLSITNSSQGSISAIALGFGSGTTSPDGIAFATGFQQNSSGGGTHSLTFSNAGNISIFGGASAVGATKPTAEAQARLGNQTVTLTSGGTSASISLTNSLTGSINVTASATATGSRPYAGAGATFNQPVIFQSITGATGGASATLNLTNQGVFDANFSAEAYGTNAFAEVGVDNRRVSAYWQNIEGSAGTAAATLSNATGAFFGLNGTALASGPGPSVTASVQVVGGWQSIQGGGTVSATFTNNGTFNVAAQATALGASPFAFAQVDSGAYQDVVANGGAGSSATANMSNTSFLSFDLTALAHATGSTFANASAEIGAAVYQYANGETAAVSFNNSGAMNLNASAFANNTGTGNASAYATITSGFSQTAAANGGDFLSASIVLMNSGDININGFARASATNDATATAELDRGVYQNADSADTASATFINTATGNFNINLTATAIGTDVFAKASNSTNIIGQFVTAGDDDLSASASILNDGDINVNMNANAFGTDGTGGPGTKATATVELSYAFQQSVFDGADTDVSFTNNGNIIFDINAVATNADFVSALIDFDTVFYMSASANGGTSDTVTATFTNNGLIDVDLNATGVGVTEVTATADLDYFLLESVQDASVANFTVMNSATGTINLDIVANATATDGHAVANAFLTSFMEITASASAGDNESATVAFTNDGVISVLMSANAIGTSRASALADASYGFYFIADDGDDVDVSFNNTGQILFDLNAFASASSDADATVDFDYPFFFSATGDGDKNSATVSFTNSATGSIIVDLDAHARGTDGTGGLGTDAFASASISTAVTIYSFDAQISTNTFTNDGTLTFSVGAVASNAVDASASAEIGYGINQSATATGGAGSVATATISNSSAVSLNFLITAQAYGSTDADASAEFDDTIIDQSAFNAETVSVSFTNSGAFNVLAQATAVASHGAADADASIDDAIEQSATASGSGANLSASATFTNTVTGTIDWLAFARATALGTNTTMDTASAFATIGESFVAQNVEDGDNSSATFTNNGTINLTAMAIALGQDANATASIDSGVSQDIDHNSTVSDQITSTATITNTGQFNMLAMAHAIGTDGTGGLGMTVEADASINTVVSQTADDADTNTALIFNSSTGVLDVQAIAIASNGTDVSAEATIGYGLYQFATGHSSPNSLASSATIDNDGAISFLVWAQATGTNTADAYAEFDNSIIIQSADGAGEAHTLFDNSGDFNISVMAIANATSGDASATVDIDDEIFQQYAFADDGNEMTASVIFNNSGNLNFLAMASANGATSATASVDYSETVFYQSATADNTSGGATATVEYNNAATGTVDVQLVAHAVGTDAFASASFSEYLIYQTADAADGDSASVAVNNDGTMTFLAKASAIGIPTSLSSPAPSASAYAFYDGTLIYQEVSNAQNASASITNNGTMNFTAWAVASNASQVTATASIGQYGFYQTVDVDGTSLETGGVASASITNTSNLSLNFTAFAQAIGITDASAQAEFDSEIIYQTAEGETALATVDNSGAFNVNVIALATAVGNGTTGFAFASASLDSGISQEANANTNDGDRLLAGTYFNNSGTVVLNASARASGTTEATAEAYNDFGLYQYPDNADVVEAEFNNDGTFAMTAAAWAKGSDAFASATFNTIVSQSANPGDDLTSASVSIVNNGTISGLAKATAIGTDGSGGPGATASATANIQTGIRQYAYDGTTGTATIVNNADIDLTILAHASHATKVNATAYLSKAITQTAEGRNTVGSTADVLFENNSSNSFDVQISAGANGVTSASAQAYINETFIFQSVENAETVSNLLENNGAISLDLDAVARAIGNGTTGYAFAYVSVERGIYQQAKADFGSELSATNVIHIGGLPNTGSIDFNGRAVAEGTTAATASVIIETPVWQWVGDGAKISNTFNNNTGSYDVLADARANGGTFASATALASYIWQTVAPTSNNTSATNIFQNRNSASFDVEAKAQAVNGGGGGQAIANAVALGVTQRNTGVPANQTANYVFFNGNEPAYTGQPETVFRVRAFASAQGGTTSNSAFAFAEGYEVRRDIDSHQVLDVTNNSNFMVTATAIGTTSVFATAIGMDFYGGELSGNLLNKGNFKVKAVAQSGAASAIGVRMTSDVNNTVFTNTGTLSVFAMGSTTAVGVRYEFDGGHTQAATSMDHASFINDGGTLMAAVSNGGSVDFGTAFDSLNAPNAVTLHLKGTNKQGVVWGNVWNFHQILVTNGMTYFAGQVNSSLSNNGQLTIDSGGTLTLASTGTGPGVIYMDDYHNTANGTLAFNVTPSTPTNGLGQVNVEVADLAGTIRLNVVPGLYANSQTYQDVVVATSTINGTYDSTSINTNTPLLSLMALYPGDGTVDLALTRNAFNGVPGLTINQMAAGSGLEGAYTTSLTGPFATLVSDLFTLNTTQYISALEQLHGAEHVQNLRVALWSMDLMNYALDERVNSGTFSNDRLNDRDSIIRRGETTLWGKYMGRFGDLEGDVEASGYNIKENSLFAGFDHSISDDFLVGFAAGAYRNQLDFTNGSSKRDEGVQLSVYGAYDTQSYYLRANFALGYYNVDSFRNINIVNTQGVAKGDYNVNVTSFHAEGGKRFEIGESAYFTPFVGFNYVMAKQNGFSETGAGGANLGLPDNKVKSFSSDLGARLAAAYSTGSNSTIIPEVFVKWRHEFKDEILNINSSYAGIPNSGFNVISSFVDSEMFVAGAGLTFTQGDKVEVRLTYTGRFNSQITDHSVGIRLSVLLGGRK